MDGEGSPTTQSRTYPSRLIASLDRAAPGCQVGSKPGGPEVQSQAPRAQSLALSLASPAASRFPPASVSPLWSGVQTRPHLTVTLKMLGAPGLPCQPFHQDCFIPSVGQWG